ncbi:hypothetical protein QBC47DRAFT_36042 [Echria macrotheca]|uniref:Clr5 domain-containing protein n=1 Tax=Echria macrotheca TaxID=438768 RepID=A0AAJ0B9D2_9PEZI|nr:hypothetical protein QBC47DRAFT_36042 [Echria macrotheca]
MTLTEELDDLRKEFSDFKNDFSVFRNEFSDFRPQRSDSQPTDTAPSQLPPPPSPSASSGIITNPVPGQLYLCYWAEDKTHYLVLILEEKSLGSVGITGTFADIGLLDEVPECYDFDPTTKQIKGWATGYEDGGPNMAKREVPVMWFDGSPECTFGWMPAEDLSEFNLESPDLKIPYVAYALEYYAKTRGFKGWIEMRQLGVGRDLRTPRVPASCESPRARGIDTISLLLDETETPHGVQTARDADAYYAPDKCGMAAASVDNSDNGLVSLEPPQIRPVRRGDPDSRWEAYKTTIACYSACYPLQDIADIMRQYHSFDATQSQYELQTKKWGWKLKKNHAGLFVVTPSPRAQP